MEKDIKDAWKACAKCAAAQIRRRRLPATFRQAEEDGMPMPRQNYGIGLYDHEQGEILAAIDLCAREVLLWFLKDRKQDHVAKALLTGLTFQTGAPLAFRNDEASEFVKGVVSAMNRHLGVDNVTTGGHNPRGNATVERFMQTLNAALRKCSDKECKEIGPCTQAIAFSHNNACNSSINCIPFECGHGLRARSVTDARVAPRLQLTDEGDTDLNQAITQWETLPF
jgi:transposase InsO family protein